MSAAIDRAGIYSDLSGLQEIRKLGGKDSPEALAAVAKQFESMFTAMMMKSMRSANAVFEEGNPGHDQRSHFYRDMFDQQLTLSLSQGKGIGIAEAMTRQMQMQYKTPPAGKSLAADAVATGVRNIQSLAPRDMQASPLRDGQRTIQSLPRTESAAGFSLEQWAEKLSVQGGQLGEMAAIEQVESAITVDVQAASDGSAADCHDDWAGGVQLLASSVNEQAPVAPLSDNGRFESPEHFIERLFPVFQRYAEPLGLDPRALLSQAALETGWGKHTLRTADGGNACNLFGIKATGNWEGGTARVNTTEFVDGKPVKMMQSFRAYENYDESVRDYVRMMAFNPRYRSAIIKGGDPMGYFRELQKAGYATDPSYAKKMFRIYSSPMLSQASVTGAQMARSADSNSAAVRRG